MADTNIGTFSPKQAREILDTIRLLKTSGLLRRKSENPRLDDPVIYPVQIKNDSGELIPPFACMQITGTTVEGVRTVLNVIKPTSTDSKYIFNHRTPIAIGGFGVALPWGVVRMLGTGSAEANKDYQPTVGAWSVEQSDGGPFVVYGSDGTLPNTLKGRIGSGGGGSGSIVRFSFQSYDYVSSTSVCADQSPHNEDVFRVFVDSFPCGTSTAHGIDSEGYIEVTDPIGFLEGFELGALEGKKGFATLMAADLNDPYGECVWEIVAVNLYESVVNVTDVVDTGDTIDIYFQRQKVWGACDLPIYQIQTADCDAINY